MWAALLLLASCTQDELADNADALPEGQYPVEIASVTISGESSVQPWGARSPQTRAEESADGNTNTTQWEVGDEFYVKFSGSDRIGTYKITDAKAGTVEAVKPLYWRSKTQQEKLIVWYTEPYTENGGTLDLSDQKDGLTYVMWGETTAAYTTEKVSLPFNHQLAKVRVVLEGDRKDDVKTVEIWSYTSCTHDQGTVKTDGATDGWITMMPCNYNGTECWEANVVPNKEIKPVKIILNGGSELSIDLTTPVIPETGKWHEITIEVKEQVKEINLSEGDYTITDDGKYILTGSYTNALIIQGSPTVTLNDANITRDNGAIIVESGNPTFTLEGENTLSNATMQTYYSVQWQPPFAIHGKETNVTIQGNGTLVVDATKKGQSCLCAIGSCNKKGGNINILGGTVKAYATSATAIGVSIGGSFGNITIANATVEVRGWPAIGSSNGGIVSNSTCGNILIENSNLSASISGGWSSSLSPAIGAGGGDDGSQMHCGTITITNTSMIRSQILSTITGDNVKIGKGNISNGTANSCGLITITGSDGTQTYSGDTGVTK